jgi:hypothetical protein
MEYGHILSRDETTLVNKADELCFSERAIFIICKDLLILKNNNKNEI